MTFKKWGWLLLAIIVVFALFNVQLIIYGLRQLSGQWYIISNAQPVEEYLNDPAVSDSVKYKLKLIDDVRQYAVQELSLTNTDNYTEMFDQKGEPVLWVVTACQPFEFKPFEWSFPVLGSVPYKGFFKIEYAENEAAELKAQGLDVNIRTVGGWSTLGWFKDPILSEMLERDEGDLANLIIHELVHATVFVKDSVTFNENLASFIADKGTHLYLNSRFGRGAPEYKRYDQNKEDQKAFIQHMLSGLSLLDSLYERNDFIGDSRGERKKALTESIMSNLDTISLNNKDYFKKINGYIPNNAYFMSFQRYQSKQDVLDSIYNYQFEGNLINFIADFKLKHGK